MPADCPRGVIYAHHVGLFDSLVARHESTTFEKLSTKVHLPLNPVYRQDSAAKPRSKLITTVLGKLDARKDSMFVYLSPLTSALMTRILKSLEKFA